jgi:hypothetical protein
VTMAISTRESVRRRLGGGGVAAVYVMVNCP